ncbi:MAG: hypothetical protein ACJ8F7_15375 [Gemmataceae bacterium]
MIQSFWQHIQSGNHSPGLLLLRGRIPLPDILLELALIAHAGDPADFADLVRYFP